MHASLPAVIRHGQGPQTCVSFYLVLQVCIELKSGDVVVNLDYNLKT